MVPSLYSENDPFSSGSPYGNAHPRSGNAHPRSNASRGGRGATGGRGLHATRTEMPVGVFRRVPPGAKKVQFSVRYGVRLQCDEMYIQCAKLNICILEQTNLWLMSICGVVSHLPKVRGAARRGFGVEYGHIAGQVRE